MNILSIDLRCWSVYFTLSQDLLMFMILNIWSNTFLKSNNDIIFCSILWKFGNTIPGSGAQKPFMILFTFIKIILESYQTESNWRLESNDRVQWTTFIQSFIIWFRSAASSITLWLYIWKSVPHCNWLLVCVIWFFQLVFAFRTQKTYCFWYEISFKFRFRYSHAAAIILI